MGLSPSGIWRWNPFIAHPGSLDEVSRFPVIKGNLLWIHRVMQSDINPSKSRHSLYVESGNPAKKLDSGACPVLDTGSSPE